MSRPPAHREAEPEASHRHRRSSLVALVLLAMGLAGIPAPASAQDPRLARLDPTSQRQLNQLFDSAASIGLAPELLLSKAYEGVSKGASGARIVIVVRQHFENLRKARATLGNEIAVDELSAAANAIRAGVSADDIAKLRSSRKGREITVPLVVLTDIISRGVPTEDAASAILKLTQGGAQDSDFRGWWFGVEQDIISGVPPAAAVERRVREFPGRAPPNRLPTAPAPRTPDAPSSPTS